MAKKDNPAPQPTYECSICHVVFGTMAELYAHITIEHPDPR